MKNVAAMLGLLLGSFAVALVCGATTAKAGVIGLAAVFAFTGIGHFLKANEMVTMLPPRFPARRATVLVSGVLELLLCVALFLPRYTAGAGWIICGFLVLITPVNIYAAQSRINFGGHGAGPQYLWVRIPLQLLLIGWSYWFAARS